MKIKVSDRDYCDIYKISSVDEIFDYYETTPSFCKYCGPRGKDVKWECSDTHDISEWKYQFDNDG